MVQSSAVNMRPFIPNIRALPPPEGIRPNFEHPPNRNKEIYIVMGVMITISTVFVFARTYTRFIVIKQRGWEDCRDFSHLASMLTGA